jgi:hypothetical protein
MDGGRSTSSTPSPTAANASAPVAAVTLLSTHEAIAERLADEIGNLLPLHKRFA